MKNLTSLFSLVFTITVFSCAQRKMEQVEATSDALDNTDQTTAQLATVPNTDLYSSGKTKIIKTLNYRFEVENVKKSTEAIEVAVRKYPAYISASNLHLENPILENNIT